MNEMYSDDNARYCMFVQREFADYHPDSHKMSGEIAAGSLDSLLLMRDSDSLLYNSLLDELNQQTDIRATYCSQ